MSKFDLPSPEYNLHNIKENPADEKTQKNTTPYKYFKMFMLLRYLLTTYLLKKLN